MMNKLVFGRKQVLKPLLDALRETSRADGLGRINELESRLEKNLERRQVLMGLMTKGYLEPALFNQENNELLAEAAQMNTEKENLSHAINGELTRTEEVSSLLRFANKEEMLTAFDGDLFEDCGLFQNRDCIPHEVRSDFEGRSVAYGSYTIRISH